jgi:YD repeat-containing protein
MSVTVAGIEFDHTHYDAGGDVLYLRVGPSREPVQTLETPEGHAVDYDESGNVIGMVLLNVRWSLENEAAITLTRPAERLDADQLQAALSAA